MSTQTIIPKTKVTTAKVTTAPNKILPNFFIYPKTVYIIYSIFGSSDELLISHPFFLLNFYVYISFNVCQPIILLGNSTSMITRFL